jgi:DNA-3-methyladenine glycosylase II
LTVSVPVVPLVPPSSPPSLRRPDVWPAGDLALRRAVERVWGLDAPASIAQVDALGERFQPWRTVAAAYLSRTRRP